MPIGNYSEAGAYLPYREASVLFPIDELQADVYHHRDAHLELADVSPDDIVAVSPTDMGSSYNLVNRPTTIIPIRSVPANVRTKLSVESGIDLDEFTHLQIGRGDSTSQNHSLNEY